MNKNEIPDIFKKPYEPTEHEKERYDSWEDAGFFNPDTPTTLPKNGETFSMTLPPPNVTGVLHLGHAAMLAIQDILVRYHRMKGFDSVWIPGTDHAAIATQSKVEKELSKKGIRRHDLGREAFLEKVNEFAQESHDTIANQIRQMGASIDWSREAFTLDEKREHAVYTAFTQMYNDGLIYRKNKVVHWDPKGQTVISDDEVIHEETKAILYTFKYSTDFPIPIATTRPETKVGDTAVAVHPDGTWKEYIGQTYTVTFCEVPLTIRIIADEEVDPEFGTGALGVTPAHSHTDYDMSVRHDLPMKQVINEYAKMTAEAGPLLEGKKTVEAREAVAQWLRDNNLMMSEEESIQNLSKAERTGGVIEPLPKLQWFIDVNKEFELKHSEIDGVPTGSKVTLKTLMLSAVRTGGIDIIPDRFEKVYFHWIENLRDWCISRQIWYGHQIPAWYRDGKLFVGTEAPEGDGWTQDEDTLDTWFSSGLWTFSTLGWPEITEDFKKYHPTSVLETGYDIIFFWVARMILMSTYLVGQIPFKTVYLHGLVLDAKGKKMSKSVGNSIDPVDMILLYGADAVRLSLIIGTGPGNDSKLSEDKIRAYKKFTNKIWNASRFVLENIDLKYIDTDNTPTLTEVNAQQITQCDETIKEASGDIENFKLYLAGEKLYHYFWHTFADVIIEENKKVLQSEDASAEDKASASYTLYFILSQTLIALHPFIPFVTETIWKELPHAKEPLIVTQWPR